MDLLLIKNVIYLLSFQKYVRGRKMKKKQFLFKFFVVLLVRFQKDFERFIREDGLKIY